MMAKGYYCCSFDCSGHDHVPKWICGVWLSVPLVPFGKWWRRSIQRVQGLNDYRIDGLEGKSSSR
jgi:hypothetical protein